MEIEGVLEQGGSRLRLAIVGSRDFGRIDKVVEFIMMLPSHYEIVSGGGGDVDNTAEVAATECNLKITIFRADWRMHGKGAGMLRNTLIAEYADKCVAFWDGKSRGTQDTINKFKRLNKPVFIIGE